jgi:hypothetical protein
VIRSVTRIGGVRGAVSVARSCSTVVTASTSNRRTRRSTNPRARRAVGLSLAQPGGDEIGPVDAPLSSLVDDGDRRRRG